MLVERVSKFSFGPVVVAATIRDLSVGLIVPRPLLVTEQKDLGICPGHYWADLVELG